MSKQPWELEVGDPIRWVEHKPSGKRAFTMSIREGVIVSVEDDDKGGRLAMVAPGVTGRSIKRVAVALKPKPPEGTEPAV